MSTLRHSPSSYAHHTFGRGAAAISAATLATTAARQALRRGRAVKRATPSRPAARRLMGRAPACTGRAQSTSAATLQAAERQTHLGEPLR